MTLSIGPYVEPAFVPPPRASDVVTPFWDAVAAKSELQYLDWSTTLFGRARQIDEAQNGKGQFSGRGPMRRAAATSPLLTKEQAEEQVRQAGVDVPVSEGMRHEALDLKIKWATKKQNLEGVVARADQGFATQFALGATSFVVGAADPVNVATTFIPVIGEAKLAYWLAKGAARFGPTAAKVIVRAGTGAYDAAVGSAVSEPIIYAAHQAVGDDYDLVDSLLNVGLGAAAGSVLRVAGGAGLDLYRGLRLRNDLTADATGRVLNKTISHLGEGKTARPAEDVAAEHGALVVPGGSASDTSSFIATASSLPADTFMVMPGTGPGGKAIDLSDQVRIKAVLREWQPVKSEGAETYRIESGGDVLVYARTPDSTKSKEAFTVERLKRDDPNYDSPLSERRLEEDAEASRRASRMLYMKAPHELDRVLTEAQMAKMDELVALHQADPLKLRPSEADGGYKVDNAIGTAVHTALSKYADGNKFLHRGWKLKKNVPDGFVSTDHAPLALEAKPESPTGISLGLEQAKGYESTFGVESVVLLYSRHVVQPRMDALNEEIIKAWNKYDPGWEDFLTKSGKKELKAYGVDHTQYLPPQQKPEQPASGLEPESLVQKVNMSQGGQP